MTNAKAHVHQNGNVKMQHAPFYLPEAPSRNSNAAAAESV